MLSACTRSLLAADKIRLEKLSVPVPPNEADRLYYLRESQLLDSERDPMFDRFCSLAKRIFDVPFALINLIDVERAFVKSNDGLPGLTEAPRDQGGPASPSVCPLFTSLTFPSRQCSVRTRSLKRRRTCLSSRTARPTPGSPTLMW